KMYSEAELIVTDYSSAIFDFAYLRKSIIYYQFDGDEYYQNNPFTKKGFFDYEKDGFGPVVKDYSILTNMLIEMADKGCALDEVYRERMDRIFAFNDKNSCERTYKKIVELLSNK
uniref:CDP-glycerol glycerophosphotransferase family protein n=1 Tax=Butyrivibrio sp. AE3009 TaxID=1280666 RepID=UPI00055AF27F